MFNGLDTTNMSNYYEIEFNDLDWAKQNELIEDVADVIVSNAVEEGENYIVDEQSAEEAYCRAYSIGFDYYDDDKVDWTELLRDWAKEQAEERLHKAFKHLEVEVETQA